MSGADRPSTERRPDRAAFVIAAALIVVAIIIAWSTYSMGGPATYARIGPKTFPFGIAAVLFVLGVCTAIAASRGEFPGREEQNIPPMLWIIGGLAAQMLLLKVGGFSIATGLLFAATARGFGRGPLWLTIPLGVVLALCLWIVFSKGLQLSLPAGPIERALFP